MNSLFIPEPRAPRTYAEECLDYALGEGGRSWTWAGLRESGASDDRLLLALQSLFGEYASVWDDGVRWVMRGGAHPRFYTGERLDWVHGRPCLQGAALLNTVRELRGIWRPV